LIGPWILLALSLRALVFLILRGLPLRLTLLNLSPLTLQETLLIGWILSLRLSLWILLTALTFHQTLLVLIVSLRLIPTSIRRSLAFNISRVLLRLSIRRTASRIHRFIGFLRYQKINLISTRSFIHCIRHRADSMQQKKRGQLKLDQTHDDSPTMS
jgi:hypothetical protein